MAHRRLDRRDAVVTGMGFCLPGKTRPVFTVDELWAVAVAGQSNLRGEEFHHGVVDLDSDLFEERVPDVPDLYANALSPAIRFGLVSLIEACADAKLDARGGDLQQAALLVGRGSVDDNADIYMEMLRVDPDQVSPEQAAGLFVRAQLAGTPYDVALLQAALTRCTGPSYTVSCGCSSTSVQLGAAVKMIADGEVDIAAVTGTDSFSATLMRSSRRLMEIANAGQSADSLERIPTMDVPMRPYDRASDSVNYGEGSATLIVESREHAERRGARIHGVVVRNAMRRDGLPSPLSVDTSGTALVDAVRACLRDEVDIGEIPYINGGSDGGLVVAQVEANAVRELYGPAAVNLLMTSQEACFGHSGAQTGNLGAALTLLMMENSLVCPTANCVEPADFLPFDPVPGTEPRPLDFDTALSFSYQIGGLKSVLLLRRDR
jgi:3-oxoacyl-[acyl-carrier-protein] synthase II